MSESSENKIIEGVIEGVTGGVIEGVAGGVVEGVIEGVAGGVVEGVIEGVTGGVVEGVIEGVAETTIKQSKLLDNVNKKALVLGISFFGIYTIYRNREYLIKKCYNLLYKPADDEFYL